MTDNKDNPSPLPWKMSAKYGGEIRSADNRIIGELGGFENEETNANLIVHRVNMWDAREQLISELAEALKGMLAIHMPSRSDELPSKWPTVARVLISKIEEK